MGAERGTLRRSDEPFIPYRSRRRGIDLSHNRKTLRDRVAIGGEDTLGGGESATRTPGGDRESLRERKNQVEKEFLEIQGIGSN